MYLSSLRHMTYVLIFLFYSVHYGGHTLISLTFLNFVIYKIFFRFSTLIRKKHYFMTKFNWDEAGIS
jgi:hypothetical protein